MKALKKIQYLDHGKGIIRTVVPSLCPKNSYKLGLNLDSDNLLGGLVSRKGSEILGVQMSASHNCLGLHHHLNEADEDLFSVFSDGTNNNIYLVASGAKSLEDDTKDLKTRFLTYLGSTVRINGVDDAMVWNGVSWIAKNKSANNVLSMSASPVISNTFVVETALTNTMYHNRKDLVVNDPIRFTTTGTLPAGLSLNTTYYVKAVTSAGTTGSHFSVSATVGGAVIDITNNGTGVHTWGKYAFVFTYNGHGLIDSNVVYLMSLSYVNYMGDTITSNIPSEFTAETNYFVVNSDDNTFQLAATMGGTPIVTGETLFFSSGKWTHKNAFDLENIPKGDIIIEWKDRIFTAGGEIPSGILKYSSITDPNTRLVSWTEDNGQIEFEQEDNGGEFAALLKIPGYLLMFKKRTMKRWDGNSAYPEDLISQGVYSQECTCVGRGIGFLINEKAIWATNGERPVKISKPIQDFIDNIPISSWPNICCISDDEYVLFSIGDITIDGNNFENIVLKYNIGYETWDIYSFPWMFTNFAKFVDTDGKFKIVGGTDNGTVIQLNKGENDNDGTSNPITWSLESNEQEFSSRANLKDIVAMNIFTENVSSGTIMIRSDSSNNIDWNSIGKILSNITEVRNFKETGHYFNIKITGATDSGQIKLLGYEFPDESIYINDNVK